MSDNENFSDLELFDNVNKESSGMKPDDLDKVVSKEKQIDKKCDCLNLVKFWKLFLQIKIAYRMIKDYKNHVYREVPWKTIFLLAAAILYFLNPFDLIPDTIPILGFTDDAAVAAIIFTTFKNEITKYCNWKGISAEELF